jgi:hypothetical protein
VNSSGGTVPAITYNGVSLTQVGTDQTAPTDNRINKLYCLANPAIGANNISVSFTGGFLRVAAASYTGVNQSGQPEAQAQSTNSGGTSWSQSVTTTSDNAWLIGMAESSGSNVVAGANTTIRVTAGGNGAYAIVDTNGAQTPPGSKIVNISGTVSFALNIGAFAPVSLTPIKVKVPDLVHWSWGGWNF